jgi:hypothetical protein
MAGLLQFLDAFAGDAAWLARYARTRDGQPIPWSVIEAHKKATQPYEVSSSSAMSIQRRAPHAVCLLLHG